QAHLVRPRREADARIPVAEGRERLRIRPSETPQRIARLPQRVGEDALERRPERRPLWLRSAAPDICREHFFHANDGELIPLSLRLRIFPMATDGASYPLRRSLRPKLVKETFRRPKHEPRCLRKRGPSSETRWPGDALFIHFERRFLFDTEHTGVRSVMRNKTRGDGVHAKVGERLDDGISSDEPLHRRAALRKDRSIDTVEPLESEGDEAMRIVCELGMASLGVGRDHVRMRAHHADGVKNQSASLGSDGVSVANQLERLAVRNEKMPSLPSAALDVNRISFENR